jgi:hypothetical protein
MYSKIVDVTSWMTYDKDHREITITIILIIIKTRNFSTISVEIVELIHEEQASISNAHILKNHYRK